MWLALVKKGFNSKFCLTETSAALELSMSREAWVQIFFFPYFLKGSKRMSGRCTFWYWIDSFTLGCIAALMLLHVPPEKQMRKGCKVPPTLLTTLVARHFVNPHLLKARSWIKILAPSLSC